MSSRVTKSRNLDIYPHFMKYDDPRDIPFGKIAEEVDKTPNSLRAMIRSARHNSTIYLALRKQGYKDHQFPEWFARPEKPAVYRREETAGTRTSAEERSGAGERPEPKRNYTRGTMDVVQEGSAERPIALSVRSAPPVHTYRIVRPRYQRPANPYLDEMYRIITKTLDDEMRESLERMWRRHEPPRPMTPNEFKAQIEVACISQNLLWQKNSQVWFIMNMLRSASKSRRIDVDELTELLSKHFDEYKSKTAAYDDDVMMERAFEIIARFIEDNIHNLPPIDDLLREYREAAREKRERERETKRELAKMMAEKRRRRKNPLEDFEREQRKIMDAFYKNLGR